MFRLCKLKTSVNNVRHNDITTNQLELSLPQAQFPIWRLQCFVFFARHNAVMSMFTFKRHKVFMPLCHGLKDPARSSRVFVTAAGLFTPAVVTVKSAP